MYDYGNAAGECYPLPERPLEPPENRSIWGAVAAEDSFADEYFAAMDEDPE